MKNGVSGIQSELGPLAYFSGYPTRDPAIDGVLGPYKLRGWQATRVQFFIDL